MKGLVGLLIGLVPLYVFIVISQATKKTLVIQVKSMKSTLCHCLKISLLFFLLLSCDGRRRKDSRVLDIITADLERRDNISVNDLFSNIQLIPLETTQESLIRTITQIRFFEGRYYIHDYSRARIFVFDENGHFLSTLDKKGDGPGMYLNLTDFDIDTVRRNLVILCAVSNALFFFDLEGNFIEKKRLPDIAGAYNSLQFQNRDTIAFFTYDYGHRLKFYSLSRNDLFNECFPEDRKDIFCRGVFPFSQAFRRALTNTVYSLSNANLTELYRWDFGNLNNELKALVYHPGMNKAEQIQYIKDAYASKSVNYVIDIQGQNSRYRYAMIVRKDKYIHLFHDRKKHELLQFERTSEGLQLYPIYFGEDFILCTQEGGLPLNDLLPENLRTKKQQTIIQSHSDEENPILVKYVFKNED